MLIRKGIGFDPDYVLRQDVGTILHMEAEAKKLIEVENEWKKLQIGAGAGKARM